MTIRAKIVADSIYKPGSKDYESHRLTTFSLRYPRFIHSQLLTHRAFSRNASSSRAIPVRKMMKNIEDDPAMPIHWGKNKKGMRAGKEISDPGGAEALWKSAMLACSKYTEKLVELGVHKQIANRLLEPWQHIDVLCTATEYSNFFNLRIASEAQPEIRELAIQMADLYYSQEPQELLTDNTWHLPYIVKEDLEGLDPIDINDTLRKMSVARCARVSYMNHENRKPTTKEDVDLHNRLLESRHMSCFEHMARPLHIGEHSKGNLRGWVSYREMLPNENQTSYSHAARMKELSGTEDILPARLGK